MRMVGWLGIGVTRCAPQFGTLRRGRARCLRLGTVVPAIGVAWLAVAISFAAAAGGFA